MGEPGEPAVSIPEHVEVPEGVRPRTRRATPRGGGDVMGGYQPAPEGSDVMGGYQPAPEGSDVMGGYQPAPEGSDVMGRIAAQEDDVPTEPMDNEP